MTGFYRTGCCETGEDDSGRHLICSLMTTEFLAFSKEQGNDLSTAMPQMGFPGLKAGDQWCLCALRWKEALEAGCAPQVVLESTHHNALQFVSMPDLHAHAVHRSGGLVS
jgi:uncharacterized protein (DUF2237 family)